MFWFTGQDFSDIIWIRTTEINVFISRNTRILKWNEFVVPEGFIKDYTFSQNFDLSSIHFFPPVFIVKERQPAVRPQLF